MVQRLVILENPEPESKALKKFLCVVRPMYKQLILSMEAFGDLSKLTIEEVERTMKSSEDADEEAAPPPAGSSTEKLLLMKEEWLEKYKQEKFGRGGSKSGSSGRRKSRGGGKPRDHRGQHGSDWRSRAGSGSGQTRPNNDCKRCGKRGHWAQHCRGKLKVDTEAHVAQEEEPTLLFARGVVEERVNPLTSLLPIQPLQQIFAGAADGDESVPQQTDLVEAKVFTALSNSGHQDQKRWVLNTGATTT
jgi:hypothetical protein